jgi:hypothetical protein
MLEHLFDSRYTVRSMAVKRAKPNPDGIITARLTGASARHVGQMQLDADAAVAELREIAGGRTDLLARQAGLIFGARERDVRDGEWPRRAVQAALLIQAGADVSQLAEWVEEGLHPAERIR